MTFTHLAEPIPITEQNWPEGTIPLVTTKTISYMHGKYIRECIEGILMQKTTFPVQVLIHDDASTDVTADIMREYERKYPKLIQCFYQEENTYGKPNRRDLMKDYHDAVAGKYIAICEGDDYWTDPLKLQKQVEFMESNPDFSMCFHNVARLSRKGAIALLYDQLMKPLSFEDIVLNPIFISLNSVVYVKELYLHKKWHNYIMQGDLVLIYCLALKGKLGYISEPMSVYRKHSSSLGATHSLTLVRFRILEFLHLFDADTGFEHHELLEEAIHRVRKRIVSARLDDLKGIHRLLNTQLMVVKLKKCLQRSGE